MVCEACFLWPLRLPCGTGKMEIFQNTQNRSLQAQKTARLQKSRVKYLISALPEMLSVRKQLKKANELVPASGNCLLCSLSGGLRAHHQRYP